MKDLLEFNRKIRSIPYLEKVNKINNFTIIINLLILAYKLVTVIISYEDFLIPSILYSIFIILSKLVFFIGYKQNLYLKEELDYFLIISIYLFLGSLSYFIYWIFEFILSPISVSFPLYKFILYILIYIIESISSLKGLFISNKNDDLLLKGLKFVDLSIAFSSFFMIIMIILEYLGYVENKYIINVFGIIISLYMFYKYFKYKKLLKL